MAMASLAVSIWRLLFTGVTVTTTGVTASNSVSTAPMKYTAVSLAFHASDCFPRRHFVELVLRYICLELNVHFIL